MLVDPTLPAIPPNDARLRRALRALETQFLSEMLKSARVGEPRGAFGGGAGEAQFASFLREEYAERIVEAGGIGLTESLFRALNGARHD